MAATQEHVASTRESVVQVPGTQIPIIEVPDTQDSDTPEPVVQLPVTQESVAQKTANKAEKRKTMNFHPRSNMVNPRSEEGGKRE